MTPILVTSCKSAWASWASKTLLSAVELELFTKLGERRAHRRELGERLGLDARAIPDFPDALVALGVLDRDGDGPEARYRNTEDTGAFLDKASPTYIGGILEMSQRAAVSASGAT